MLFWNENENWPLHKDRSDEFALLIVESTNLRDENMLQVICRNCFSLIFFKTLFYLDHFFLTATMMRHIEKHHEVFLLFFKYYKGINFGWQ